MDWLSLLPGVSRDKPRFMALVEAVIQQVNDFLPLIAQLQSGFSFAEAEGMQLDQVAEAVGLSRPDIGTNVSDEAFRQYLLAKLALWAWDGTNKTVSEVLHMALPGCTQTDNGNGTVTITGGNGERVAKVAPYPAGVKLILNE